MSTSRLQKDVCGALRRMGCEVEQEVCDQITGYVVDSVVSVSSDSVVVVEVDGPSHFCGNSRRVRGETLLKRRLLARSQFGFDKFRLVSIPYWEWNELGGRQDREESYLRSKVGI